ncbi:MAG: transglycosylase domain-containing protein [Pseudomonadota bacterium]
MKIIKIIACIILILVLVLFSLGFFYYKSVWVTGLEIIKRDNVQKIMSAESPVYYEDETNLLGVFFQEEHRRYIKFEDIPKDFVNALIAAEDHDFYKHRGFDFKAILRAFFVNIKSGGIVQGGSTITQQTAKNIFKREKRSFRGKIKELLHAFILESFYTKNEILEFYSNQFFVNSNGRGIGVAAGYFFDKPASELNLVESAFIAGAVKGPNKYNPFTKNTPEEKEEVELLAKERKNYVLKNMYKLGMISEEGYQIAKEENVPFKEGQIGYRLKVVLDYIRDQLQSELFQEILLEQGIDNFTTSGIKIYTTVNKEIQESSFFALKRNLSFLETKLNGYDREIVQNRYASLVEAEPEKLEVGNFCFGKVSKVTIKGRSSHIDVEFKNAKGRIDYSGILRLGNAWMKSRIGEWAEIDESHIKEFLKRFQPGDFIFVYIKEYDSESDILHLELEQRPEVEGGIIVLKNGEVKAMIGGFKDEFFNRAVSAKRQLGSIFKPIVYTAALQLGWNNLDALENDEKTFEFEETLYSPRPDHENIYPIVSLEWAGVKSENIATVWLLYNLCNKLDMNQFRQVAEKVGLAQRNDESYNEYATRIRDNNGVLVNDTNLKEAAFEDAKKELITDLIFEGKEFEIKGLNSLKLEDFSENKFNYKYSPETIDRLSIIMKRHYKAIKSIDPYDFRILSRIRDFRVLVGLKYVVRLSEKMGISTKLDEVLSFPLGSNSISILEASLVYHTIISGKIYSLTENGNVDNIPIIKKIVDPQGEVIYEYKPKDTRILDERISNMVTSILRNVVKHGTGSSAEGRIVLQLDGVLGNTNLKGASFKIPVFGKTGTSNDYTNSSYCGFIPGPSEEKRSLDTENSYVIASYVGYDDNKPLESKHIKIYGASGALPIWIDVAKALVKTKEYSSKIDTADLIFQGVNEIPLNKAPEMISVAVDNLNGMPLRPDRGEKGLESTLNIDTYGKMTRYGFTPNRFFSPYP